MDIELFEEYGETNKYIENINSNNKSKKIKIIRNKLNCANGLYYETNIIKNQDYKLYINFSYGNGNVYVCVQNLDGTRHLIKNNILKSNQYYFNSGSDDKIVIYFILDNLINCYLEIFDIKMEKMEYGNKTVSISNKINSSIESNIIVFDRKNIKFPAKQIHISESLEHFSRIQKIYNFEPYTDRYAPAVFFGIYSNEDREKIRKHRNKIYVIWGGTDLDQRHKLGQKNVDFIRTIKRLKLSYAISIDMEQRLTLLGLKFEKLKLDLVDRTLFKPLKKFGNKIYVYDGLHQDRKHIYGGEIVNSIIRKFPEFDFIRSTDLKVSHDSMPQIYAQSFIGLRLTKHDGNANTVQEMGAMGLPVIHNGTYSNCLNWDSEDDIELRIKYRNIELFEDSIRNFNKILIICNDYPGYGGAATNSYDLINYFHSRGKDVLGLFVSDKKCPFSFDNKIKIINPCELHNFLKNINFTPDLIILRNWIDFNIKSYFSCPTYFLIPGVFEPSLNINFRELDSKIVIDKYIHQKILATINIADRSFCASYHSIVILKKYFDIDIEILYFNYFKFKDQFYSRNADKNWEHRKYDYGIIVSDTNRIVKNVKKMVSKLDQDNNNILIVGKNSSQYRKDNITCVELVNPSELSSYYQDIKFLCNSSHYESCSNVIVEGKFGGCKIIDPLKDPLIQEKKKFEISNNNLMDEFNDQNIDVVGIYKVNPVDDEKLIIEPTPQKLLYTNEDDDQLIQQIIDSDIYLKIILKLRTKFNFKNIHYVYLKDCICFNYQRKFNNPIRLEKYIGQTKLVIWIIDTYDKIFNFRNAKMYFMRGEYHNTYHYLGNNNSIKILYPAVSLVFNYSPIDMEKKLCYGNMIKTLRKKLDDKFKYDIVLTHEDSYYSKKYTNTNLLLFKKWSNPDQFYFKNMKREYLFCIVATAKQSTKNHDLFFNFFAYYDIYLSYLGTKEKVKIAYVSNLETLTKNFNLRVKKYKNINITFLSNLNSDDLSNIYNRSRVNLIFSGRDACPRVISESGNCGCYNVALDTLSDGKFYYDGILGSLIGDSNGDLLLKKSHSISYDMNNLKIWGSLVDILDNDYDHKNISQTFIENYNEKNFINEIAEKISIASKIKNINILDNNNNPKILITSTQYPHYGGSATTAYHTAKFLRKCGFKCTCLFFENRDVDFDPENLGGVYRSKFKKGFIVNSNEFSQLKNKINNILGGKPDLILGFNYGAPILIRQIYSDVKLVYCISGVPTLTIGANSAVNNKISIQTALKNGIKNYISDDLYKQEKKCIEVSDYCSPYSELISRVFTKVYPEYLNKLVEPSHTAVNNIFINKKTNILCTDKDIDIIAVASNWERTVKNYDTMIKVFKLFPSKNKVIIGVNDNMKIQMNNLTCYDRVDYNTVQKLLSKSKIILVPSYSESGPNVILEALENGCVPITSRNIGFVNYLDKTNLVDDVYDIEEFYEKISFKLNNFYKCIPKKISKLKKVECDSYINFINKYSKNNIPPKILFITCDIPNIGGASTNTYNMIRELRKNDIECYGLFLTNINGEVDPNNLGDIYKVAINKDIEKSISVIIKDLNFNIVFYKNYKVFAYTSHLFNNTIKIFSPSGLRYLTSEISKQNVWYQDVILKENVFSDREIKFNGGDILQFVKNNDQYLEKYVFENSDYILPNSTITWNIIKKIDIFNSKLLNPIYLTNINLQNKGTILPFETRHYDLVFVAYSWKRKCKNYALVKELLKSKHLLKLNVAIIGKDQDLIKKTTQFDLLDRDKMNEILKNTKTVVIPSFYDSNPNVLVEAVSWKCNIVTSSNVGNHQFISKNLLVTRYRDQKDWRKKIYASLEKYYEFDGYKQDEIIKQMLSLFNYTVNKNVRIDRKQ